MSSGSNQAVAPVAVWALLVMLSVGATGDARRELQAATGAAGDVGVTAGLGMLEYLTDGVGGVHVAAAVWAHPDVIYTPWWQGAVTKDLRLVLSGDPALDQRAIDEWARSRTEGLIEGLSFDLSDDTRMLLASALAIDVRWNARFDNWLPMRLTEGPWAKREVASLNRESRDLDEVSIIDAPAGPLTVVSVTSERDVVVHVVLGPDSVTAGEVLSGCIRGLTGDLKKHPARRSSRARMRLGSVGASTASIQRRPSTK
jgi:hypothetical protein